MRLGGICGGCWVFCSGGTLAHYTYPIMLSRHEIVNWELNLASGIC